MVYRRQVYKQQQANMVLEGRQEARYWEGVQVSFLCTSVFLERLNRDRPGHCHTYVCPTWSLRDGSTSGTGRGCR
jgi:hypothetical protein